MVKWLLSQGVDVDEVVSLDGETALLLFASQGELREMVVLLESGASVDRVDYDGQTLWDKIDWERVIRMECDELIRNFMMALLTRAQPPDHVRDILLSLPVDQGPLPGTREYRRAQKLRRIGLNVPVYRVRPPSTVYQELTLHGMRAYRRVQSLRQERHDAFSPRLPRALRDLTLKFDDKFSGMTTQEMWNL
jgi:hypothetical protein